MARGIDHKLSKHLLGTYLGLRRGVIIVAASLPFLLWWVGRIRYGIPLQGSISAYYHTGMGDVFVGALFAVGALLVTYRGFSQLEDRALDLACAFLLGVALIPVRPPGQPQPPSDGLLQAIADFLTLHATSAVLFFSCIAYVALFRAGDTLSLIRPDSSRPWHRRPGFYRMCYKMAGRAMILSPFLAAAVAFQTRSRAQGSTYVFWLETFAVLSFSAYWVAKSRELRQTSAEQLAASGSLSRTAAPASYGGRVIQVAPDDLLEGLSPVEMDDVLSWWEPDGPMLAAPEPRSSEPGT